MTSISDQRDVLVNTEMYGIHDPKNFHSFANTRALFVPTLCLHCETLVYPMISACVCLRCCCYVHRSCAAKAPKCQYFTFWPTSGEDSEHVLTIGVNTSSIVKQACTIPKLLGYMPLPGSEFCIWRTALRAVAMNHDQITRSLVIEGNNLLEIQSIVSGVLSDTTSFPAAVAEVVHTIFINLAFEKHDSSSSISEVVISHARECLDSVVCALLSVGDSNWGTNADIVRSVCNCIDRHMLNKNFGVMYSKIFKHVVSDSLHATMVLPHQTKSVEFTETDYAIFEESALDLCAMVTARDKLDRVVIFLRRISNQLSLRFTDKSGHNALQVTAAAAVTPSSVSIPAIENLAEVSTSVPRPCSEGGEDIGDDECSTDGLENKRFVDTDDIIQACVFVIEKQLREKSINWIAESVYIASSLLRDQDSLIGVEGYALATLQQCLNCVSVNVTSVGSEPTDIDHSALVEDDSTVLKDKSTAATEESAS